MPREPICSIQVQRACRFQNDKFCCHFPNLIIHFPPLQNFFERRDYIATTCHCHSLALRIFIMRQFFLFTLLRSIIVAKALDALEPPLQPDLYLPAVLPANFSIRPSHWEHSTPLLQKSRPFDPLLRRANSVTRYWHGWQSLQYLFVLCA